MTEKQFQNLKIGDIVLRSHGGQTTTVEDIHRQRGLVRTGDSWRKYQGVRFPVQEPAILTKLEPVTHMNLSVKLMHKFSMSECMIIHTILRTGDEGFVGHNETLSEAAQLCVGIKTFNVVIFGLTKAGYIRRENLAKRLTRYTINHELIDRFL